MRWIPLLSLLAVIIDISCKQKPVNNAAIKVNPYVSMDDIPVDTARAHIKNFKNKLASLNDPSDSRSVWFPIAELKHFLDSNVAKDPAIDGVRIYFATYNQKPDADYSFKNTLILVLTKDSSKYHKDYYQSEILEPTLIKTVSPSNQGELCPQNCEGADLLHDNQ